MTLGAKTGLGELVAAAASCAVAVILAEAQNQQLPQLGVGKEKVMVGQLEAQRHGLDASRDFWSTEIKG